MRNIFFSSSGRRSMVFNCFPRLPKTGTYSDEKHDTVVTRPTWIIGRVRPVLGLRGHGSRPASVGWGWGGETKRNLRTFRRERKQTRLPGVGVVSVYKWTGGTKRDGATYKYRMLPKKKKTKNKPFSVDRPSFVTEFEQHSSRREFPARGLPFLVAIVQLSWIPSRFGIIPNGPRKRIDEHE